MPSMESQVRKLGWFFVGMVGIIVLFLVAELIWGR